MAGYECDLRRLFRPPVDHLPPTLQLQHYRQRDLVPSHLYRLGTGIFGNIPRRRRIIDASLFSPPQRTPHLRSSLDGRLPQITSKEVDDGVQGEHTYPPQAATGQGQGGSFTEAQYREWVSSRQQMRSGLEALGASERWLCAKERTPLENNLLVQMRRKRQEAESLSPETKTISEEESTHTTPSPADSKRDRARLRKQILREISQLQQYLTRHRQRLVTLLMAADKRRDRHVSVEEFLTTMGKLRAPVSQEVLELLVDAVKLREDGRMDYRVFLNGGFVKLVEEHLQRVEVGITVASSESIEGRSDVPVHGDSGQNVAASTLGGENGRLVEDYKQEELRQFNALISYCKANDTVLTWELAEKALLLPADHSRQECMAQLRQPGLAVLSSHFADSPSEEKEEELKRGSVREEFGGAYKELHGRGKSKFVRLSTGPARVKAKTDCWLTYEEFERLTEHIRSRPGFKFKYHGLPDNNAFWPGALLDKLRLWQPHETLMDKPYSLYNIFQPVQHPKICNPFSPIVEQRMAWPENQGGYVQFGSQNRKKYCL